MKNHIFIALLLCILLCSCTADVQTIYNRSYTKSQSVSEPIYLSFRENKDSSFYFILKHKAPSNEYLLYVRWDTKEPNLIFDGTNTVLKFLVDANSVIRLQPVKQPRMVAYNIDKGHQEEAIFSLTLDQMQTIANAKKVEVELNGKYITVAGHFNKLQTFKAFRKFLSE